MNIIPQVICTIVQLVVLFITERRIRHWHKLRKETMDFFWEQQESRKKWYMEAEQKLQEISVNVNKHGKWIKERDTLKCSECGFGYFPASYFFEDGHCKHTNYEGDYKFNFCPDCGVDMREVIKHDNT